VEGDRRSSPALRTLCSPHAGRQGVFACCVHLPAHHPFDMHGTRARLYTMITELRGDDTGKRPIGKRRRGRQVAGWWRTQWCSSCTLQLSRLGGRVSVERFSFAGIHEAF